MNARRVAQFGFAAPLRLRRKREFDAAFETGRRISDSFFSLSVRPNDLAFPRLGLAIAARTVGNAVARNRVRRTIKESFRLHQRVLPAVDIVVGARNAARAAPNADMRASLERLWQRVISQCAPSSAA